MGIENAGVLKNRIAKHCVAPQFLGKFRRPNIKHNGGPTLPPLTPP